MTVLLKNRDSLWNIHPIFIHCRHTKNRPIIFSKQRVNELAERLQKYKSLYRRFWYLSAYIHGTSFEIRVLCETQNRDWRPHPYDNQSKFLDPGGGITTHTYKCKKGASDGGIRELSHRYLHHSRPKATSYN